MKRQIVSLLIVLVLVVSSAVAGWMVGRRAGSDVHAIRFQADSPSSRLSAGGDVPRGLPDRRQPLGNSDLRRLGVRPRGQAATPTVMRSEKLSELSVIVMPDLESAQQLHRDLENTFVMWEQGDLKSWAERLALVGIALRDDEKADLGDEHPWKVSARTFMKAEFAWETASPQISQRHGKRQFCPDVEFDTAAQTMIWASLRPGLPDPALVGADLVVLGVEISWRPSEDSGTVYRRIGLEFLRLPDSPVWILSRAITPHSGRPGSGDPLLLPPV